MKRERFWKSKTSFENWKGDEKGKVLTKRKNKKERVLKQNIQLPTILNNKKGKKKGNN